MEMITAIGALAALAQEARLKAFRLLVEAGPVGLAAGLLAERLGIAPPTMSFHLAELAHAGLVRARRAGRSIIYSADFTAMNGLVGYLTENCCRASAGCAPAKSRIRHQGDPRHETSARLARR
ncbi:MAG: ArsR/SmtB family transcription factor [Dongiaceae bacterium]